MDAKSVTDALGIASCEFQMADAVGIRKGREILQTSTESFGRRPVGEAISLALLSALLLAVLAMVLSKPVFMVWWLCLKVGTSIQAYYVSSPLFFNNNGPPYFFCLLAASNRGKLMSNSFDRHHHRIGVTMHGSDAGLTCTSNLSVCAGCVHFLALTHSGFQFRKCILD